MPILNVEIVVPDGNMAPPELSGAIADAAARVFQSPPGHTWVCLSVLSRERYAENGGGPEPEVFPVFVRVLRSAVPSEPDLRREAAALAAAVARACVRPVENVHVLYEAPAAGRIAFGGRL